MHSKTEKLLYDNEEIKTIERRQYNNIIFEFSRSALFIKFKPHYFYNSNLHNANDFNIHDCIGTLSTFLQLFDVNPGELQIINIEFGVNVEVPHLIGAVPDILACMIFHNRNPFYGNHKYAHCKFSHSINKQGSANVYKVIKTYAKGIQYPLFADRNTLRYEIKSNRKEYINRLGIQTMYDLLNPNIYNVLTMQLITEFRNILIIDDQAKPLLEGTKLVNHNKKNNPLYWSRLLNRSQNVFRTNFMRYENALYTCRTHLKKELRKLIFDKLLELKMCAYLSIYKDQIPTQTLIK